MRRVLLYIVVILSPFLVKPQALIKPTKVFKSYIRENLFDKNAVYFFCRGTTTKSKLIATHFNLLDTLSTHIGIGFFKMKKLDIYNVTNFSTRRSAYNIETITEFIESSDVYSLKIWKIHLTRKEKKKVQNYCRRFIKKKIIFDYKFNLSKEKDDTLYCSEFCANLLNSLNPKKFNFSPVSKNIENTLAEVLLNKKIILYYPIDFFLGNKFFTHSYSFLF
jgi:hypothetical protein